MFLEINNQGESPLHLFIMMSIDKIKYYLKNYLKEGDYLFDLICSITDINELKRWLNDCISHINYCEKEQKELENLYIYYAEKYLLQIRIGL